MAKRVVKKIKASFVENQPAHKQSIKKKAATAGVFSTKKAVKKVNSADKRRTPLGAPSEQPRAVIPENSTPLTAEQLGNFRKLLLEKLAEITGDVNHIESEALKTSRGDAAGDLSSMPIHMADIGSDNYEQEFVLGLMNSERIMVREIIAALKRIDNGTYGICEGTGEPIPLTRLNGIPWTRYCLRYAAMQEKGKARQAEHAESGSDEYAPAEQDQQEHEVHGENNGFDEGQDIPQH